MKKPTKLLASVLYTIAYTAMTVALMWAMVGLFSIDVHADDEKLAAIELLDPTDKDEAILIQQGLALREWSEQIKVKVYLYRAASIVICAVTFVGAVLSARSVKRALATAKDEKENKPSENKEGA